MTYKTEVYLESADGKLKGYGLPNMSTVGDTIKFLSQFKNEDRLVFTEKDNYAGALHMICDDVSTVVTSPLTENGDPITYVQFHLKSPFMVHVATKAGKTITTLKSKAARENGKKGGRPKTKQE